MIVIRSGIFETNSSSTHTCVLCTHDNYVRWCKNELVYTPRKNNDFFEYINIKELVKKYSKPEYIIDDIFVDVKAFDDISMENVFEYNDTFLRRYNNNSKKYTLGDIWKVYRKFDYSNIMDGDIAFEDVYKKVKKEYPNIDEIRDILNSIDNNTMDLSYDTWTYFFRIILAIYGANSLRHPYMEEEDLTRATFGDQDIVAFCTYGRD